MTPDEFNTLDAASQKREIDRHNDHVRTWVVTCQNCGFRMIGTLAELRDMECPKCKGKPRG